MNEFSVSVKNVTKQFTINSPRNFAELFKRFTDRGRKMTTLTALENVSFSVSRGEILGILGLNGSGKTTLLRVIAGVYKPDLGIVTLNGKLAPLLQIGTGFHNELVPRENIIMYGLLLGMSKSEIENKVDSIIEFAGLEQFSNTKLKYFSSGMRARLAFATSIQIESDILLVDEVLAVGDILFKEKSFNVFRKFKEQGKTIIFTTHSINMISELSNRVLVLHKGKCVFLGEPKQAIEQYKQLSLK